MYADFYGFRELPFNVTPDPRFLYLNDCYQEALAALTYGIDARKGFISLIGDAGTGKTTILRRLLDSVAPATKTVLLLNPTVTFDEILEHILLELGVPPEGGRKLVLLQRLNEFLLEHTRAGGNVALLIDEAQDLKPSVLEELRLLSNLETAREKILQIVLAGQSELDLILSDPSLRQLRQRVTLRLRLRPLTPPEVAGYVRTRLERVGAPAPAIFAAEALGRIAELSGGIPRLVNVLCDAALLAAFASGSRNVTPAIVDEAWTDYAIDGSSPTSPRTPPWATAAVAQATSEPESTPVVQTEDPGVRDDGALAPAAAAAAASAPVSVRPAAAPPLPRVPPEDAPGRVPHRTLSVPVAAGLVAAMAVAVAVVSLRTNWNAADVSGTPDVPAVTQELGGDGEATAAEPPRVEAYTPPPVPTAASAASAGDAPARPDAPLSASEAATVIEQYKDAYQARDIDRLLGLFAADATENGVRGLDAIGALYRTTLPALNDVRYMVPSFSVEARRTGADVRAPFIITYTKGSGGTGTIRGQAEWELERRHGRALIVALNYRLDPES